MGLKQGGKRDNSGRPESNGFAKPVTMRFNSEAEWQSMEQFTPRQRTERILYGTDNSDLLLSAIQNLAVKLEVIEAKIGRGVMVQQVAADNNDQIDWQQARKAMENFE